MTPHIKAKKNEIASFVLMPGDPLRAKYIAGKYLADVRQVSDVRNMLMFTGMWKKKRVSICASGMGQPSIGIYSFELYKYYGVDTIIRIGSAGSYLRSLNLFDVVVVKKAKADNYVFAERMLHKKTKIASPTQGLNQRILSTAKKMGTKVKTVVAHSADVFYTSEKFKRPKNTECVEMESYALFVVAQALNKKAGCILTISDNLVTKKKTTCQERQSSFNEMILLALEQA